MIIINNAISQETAFIQPDYPYGRTLRCQRRVWVETRPKFGQRMVTQTNDPKKDFEKWNAVKPGNYFPIVVLTLDEATDPEPGYIKQYALSGYDSLDKIEEFETKFGAGLTDEQKNTLKYMKMVRQKQQQKREETSPG